MQKILAALIFIFLCAPAFAQSSSINKQFRNWLETSLWPRAEAEGISRATFDAGLGDVSPNLELPDLVMPGQKPKPPKIQTQAEFSAPAKYFNEKNITSLVSGGKARAKQHAGVLAVLEKKYGVPRQYLLAIWGRESGFGTVKIPYDAFEVLGTKAFMSTRRDFFEVELLAALQILERGYMSRAGMRTSWAGALGQPQFMPSSYLKHAVDFDGDGRRDIWNSVPDTLASIANYLVQFGWEPKRGWGVEVTLPSPGLCVFEGPDKGQTGQSWANQVARVDGKSFSARDLKSENFLVLPAGTRGPAFLATPNFYVIKNYNISDLYTIFIGHVADRIVGGSPGFAAPWQPMDKMQRSQILAVQEKLQAQGYDIGKADGLPGFKTRRSIGEWQIKAGMEPGCFPDPALSSALQ